MCGCGCLRVRVRLHAFLPPAPRPPSACTTPASGRCRPGSPRHWRRPRDCGHQRLRGKWQAVALRRPRPGARFRVVVSLTRISLACPGRRQRAGVSACGCHGSCRLAARRGARGRHLRLHPFVHPFGCRQGPAAEKAVSGSASARRETLEGLRRVADVVLLQQVLSLLMTVQVSHFSSHVSIAKNPACQPALTYQIGSAK